MNKKLQRAVQERAGNRCEYCEISPQLSEEPFNTDHVIAEQHLGPTSWENLAYSCGRCNRSKGPNIAGTDPVTHQLVYLFNPRKDTWKSHFAWKGPLLEGLTPTGRVTVLLLGINDSDRVELRSTLIEIGMFPPAPD
jgi:hypothetical protein